jgi:4'-phosphopantetheinyl transferase
VNPGEAHVWRVRLNEIEAPSPTPGELARAARFRFETHKQQYLRSHGAMRAILGKLTDRRLDFAVAEGGKPYLPGDPHLKFNLAHSGEMALVGAALDIEIGVDVEQLRPLSNYTAMAERFFPPSEAAGVSDERDFFRRWTRVEAALKASGVGIYAAGTELIGPWTIEELEVGPDYAAAVALPEIAIKIFVHDFGGDG